MGNYANPTECQTRRVGNPTCSSNRANLNSLLKAHLSTEWPWQFRHRTNFEDYGLPAWLQAEFSQGRMKENVFL